MQSTITSQAMPIWNKFQQVHLFLYFKNKDSDFAKQATEAFKALEKKHPKRIGSVSASNSKLIEEQLLPMIMVQDLASGEIVAQVLHFADHFSSKAGITAENAEKLLKTKGVLEITAAGASKAFENKKEEADYELCVGSSFLHDQLNNQEVENLNNYIKEKERIIELNLTPQTINYRECLIDSYRGVEDPFSSEIADLTYDQNPIDPALVQRNVVFKRDDPAHSLISTN